ncbi:hypothetical protein [Leptolyngbya sp. 7M]|uniref:hypothetical protein n=1 Tax=Leptolyngbya sp. 7M TaxID=2812896 RepID=UPI001B8B3F51|nr:hypothetical protein [Leptolyngbya sp. 7M]QYO64543.1 hypothetical protein JVX88_33630 [Leptolyngbya sp. 7M]
MIHAPRPALLPDRALAPGGRDDGPASPGAVPLDAQGLAQPTKARAAGPAVPARPARQAPGPAMDDRGRPGPPGRPLRPRCSPAGGNRPGQAVVAGGARARWAACPRERVPTRVGRGAMWPLNWIKPSSAEVRHGRRDG